MHNREKRKKTTYDEAKAKTVSKNNPSSHKNHSTQVMHGLRTMKKGRK